MTTESGQSQWVINTLTPHPSTRPGDVEIVEAFLPGQYICTVHLCFHVTENGIEPDDVTTTARANLIAAAPELLAVLKTILDVWDSDKIIGPMTHHDARSTITAAERQA